MRPLVISPYILVRFIKLQVLRRFTNKRDTTFRETPELIIALAASARMRSPRWPVPLVSRSARECWQAKSHESHNVCRLRGMNCPKMPLSCVSLIVMRVVVHVCDNIMSITMWHIIQQQCGMNSSPREVLYTRYNNAAAVVPVGSGISL